MAEMATALEFTGLFCLLAKFASHRCAVPLRFRSREPMLMLLIGAALEIFALQLAGTRLQGYGLSIALAAVVVSAVTDAATGFVFDFVSLPAVALILVISICSHSLVPAISGIASCAGSLLFLNLATRCRGLGLGDVKLACSIGAALGVSRGLAALGVAFVFGGAYAAALLVSRKARRGDTLRFAPYMAAGVFSILFFGPAR